MMKIKPMADENAFNSLTINLTNRCNTRCRYCFQNSGPSEKEYIKIADVQRVLEFFATIQKSGKKFLQLTGGEIFLDPDIFEIIQIGLSFGYILRLQTNGIFLNDLNEDGMRILSDNRVLIKVSLDGWNSKIHERWRARNTFNKVISGIIRLRKFSNNVAIKTVVHDSNLSEFYRMLDVCLDLGARGFSYNLLRFEGRGELLKRQFDEIQERNVISALLPHFRQKKYQHLLNGTWIMRYHRRILEGSSIIDDPGRFYIDYNGSIYPDQSCLVEQKIGSIFGEHLSDEFNFMKLYSKKISIPEDVFQCIDCFFKEGGG